MTSHWTVRSAVRRAGEVLGEEGLRTLWFKVLGETVYRRMTLVELALEPPPPPREAELELTFGFVDASAGPLPTSRSDLTPAEIEGRFNRGDRCFVARHDGHVVSARWITDGRAWVEYLGRDLELDEDEVYLYETYTAPEYRGLAVSAAAGTRLAGALAAEGRRRIVGGVVPENSAALRTAAKTGFKEAGRAGFVRLGPWRHDFTRRET